jgi:hypothetical protein
VARAPDDARRLFRDLARDISAACDEPWRRSVVDGKDRVDLGRFHLAVDDRTIELAVDVPGESLAPLHRGVAGRRVTARRRPAA